MKNKFVKDETHDYIFANPLEALHDLTEIKCPSAVS